MTSEERQRAKDKCIEVRQWGGDYEDCALLAGISVDTLGNWRRDDSNFSEDLQAAWAHYKMGLIKSVKATKPDYLLQNDFAKRFKKANEQPTVTNNVLILGDDKLSELLYGFTQRLTNAKDQGNSSNNATGGEAITSDRPSTEGTGTLQE